MSDYINGGVDSANANLINIKNDLTTLRPLLKNLKTLILGSFSTQSGSGAIVQTTLGADDVPVKSLIGEINAVQSGSGDPSPTNIRPITGWSEYQLKHRGKNLIYCNASGGSSSNVAFTRNDDYSLTFTGKSNGTTRTPTLSGSFSLVAGTYTLSGISGGSADTYGLRVQSRLTSSDTFTELFTLYDGEQEFTLTENRQVRLVGRFSNVQTSAYNVTMYPMLRTVGDSTYEMYVSKTQTVSFGDVGTVYGATLNVLTGKLSITHGYLESNADGSVTNYYPDGTTANYAWSYNSPYAYCGAGSATFVPVASLDSLSGMCSQYKEVQSATSTTSADCTFTFRVTSSIRRFTFRDTTIPDWGVGSTNAQRAEKVTAYWAAQYALGNKLQAVYKLATPYEVQLTPHQVRTLLGVNNIWADCGDISCEYRIDRTLYLDTL